MSSPTTGQVKELIGIYHADGGAVGEVKYVLGKLLGTTHCALCDITHSPIRRKPAWDSMVTRIEVPFTLLHLNELPADVATATTAVGSPVVLARLDDNSLVQVLGPADLDQLHGSLEAFEVALVAALADLNTNPTPPLP